MHYCDTVCKYKQRIKRGLLIVKRLSLLWHSEIYFFIIVASKNKYKTYYSILQYKYGFSSLSNLLGMSKIENEEGIVIIENRSRHQVISPLRVCAFFLFIYTLSSIEYEVDNAVYLSSLS